MKCSFSCLTFKISKESKSLSPNEAFLMIATSNQVICKDLLPEGLWYPNIIQSLNQAPSFEFRLSISSDPSRFQSEAIISFYDVRLLVCR
jgi:hypothetical protein